MFVLRLSVSVEVSKKRRVQISIEVGGGKKIQKLTTEWGTFIRPSRVKIFVTSAISID